MHLILASVDSAAAVPLASILFLLRFVSNMMQLLVSAAHGKWNDFRQALLAHPADAPLLAIFFQDFIFAPNACLDREYLGHKEPFFYKKTRTNTALYLSKCRFFIYKIYFVPASYVIS